VPSAPNWAKKYTFYTFLSTFCIFWSKCTRPLGAKSTLPVRRTNKVKKCSTLFSLFVHHTGKVPYISVKRSHARVCIIDILIRALKVSHRVLCNPRRNCLQINKKNTTKKFGTNFFRFINLSENFSYRKIFRATANQASSQSFWSKVQSTFGQKTKKCVTLFSRRAFAWRVTEYFCLGL